MYHLANLVFPALFWIRIKRIILEKFSFKHKLDSSWVEIDNYKKYYIVLNKMQAKVSEILEFPSAKVFIAEKEKIEKEIQ